jgi:hypothetical protein
VISPFLAFKLRRIYYSRSVGGYSKHWAGPSIDIEYRFAVPKEELRGTPQVKVELLPIEQ